MSFTQQDYVVSGFARNGFVYIKAVSITLFCSISPGLVCNNEEQYPLPQYHPSYDTGYFKNNHNNGKNHHS